MSALAQQIKLYKEGDGDVEITLRRSASLLTEWEAGYNEVGDWWLEEFKTYADAENYFFQLVGSWVMGGFLPERID